jgi:hypothetical protein
MAKRRRQKSASGAQLVTYPHWLRVAGYAPSTGDARTRKAWQEGVHPQDWRTMRAMRSFEHEGPGGAGYLASPGAAKRRKKPFGSADDRYVVSGPARWPRSFHTSKTAALAAGHACSAKFPDAICKVAYGLPGMQKTVAECNRNECWNVGGGVGVGRPYRKSDCPGRSCRKRSRKVRR